MDEIFSLHPFKRPDSGICDRGCILSAIFRKPGSCLWDFAGAKSLFCSDHIGVFVPCILDLSLSAGRSAFLSGLCYNDALLSGAVGNFIDRIFRNYVVDFFYFELINFPIFNVADIYVTCGAALFFIVFILYTKKKM